jgi:hypothetical protein
MQNPFAYQSNELFQLIVPFAWVSACDSERNHERARSDGKMGCATQDTDDRCQGGSRICHVAAVSSRIRVTTPGSRQDSTACSGILRLCGDGVMQGAVYPRLPCQLECLLEVRVWRWPAHYNFVSYLSNLMVPPCDSVRDHHLLLISSPDFEHNGIKSSLASGIL